MENASKALIIAGAILLSILIIALGMNVFNSANSSAKGANLDGQEISSHNSQFLAYEGKTKGNQIRSLVSAIKQNNQNYEDRMIEIQWSSAAATAKVQVGDLAATDAYTTTDPNASEYQTISNEIKNNSTYYVTFGYREDQLISVVDIHLYSNNDI